MQNYFSEKELSCPCCGINGFNPNTLDKINAIRHLANFKFVGVSAYRCPDYNTTRGFTQTHATGQAMDIPCSHKKAYKLIQLALENGITGIGISQKGAGRFIHLDDLEEELPKRPRPHIWSY